MRGIIFIDRDGVICREKRFLSSAEELELIESSARGIKLLNNNFYKVVVITNQPVVARGLCSIKDVEEINKTLNNLIQKESGGMIDAFYFCPHHPSVGENPIYTRDCECRKPKPGMILSAMKDFGINGDDRCYMIGDKIGDIKAGRDAGCKTILVETGYGGNEGFDDAIPDYKTENLYEAIKIILDEK